MRGSHQIVLRKNYWVSDGDYRIEDNLIEHPVALGLVYSQIVAEVQIGWLWLSNPDIQQQLAHLQASGKKREYLELARTIKYYGYTHFSPCISDFPDPNTPVEVSSGNNEICLRLTCDDGSTKEGSFRITRISCWRLSL